MRGGRGGRAGRGRRGAGGRPAPRPRPRQPAAGPAPAGTRTQARRCSLAKIYILLLLSRDKIVESNFNFLGSFCSIFH